MNSNTNNNELYIVTGAAGNLGSAIVRKLVRENKAVRALVLRVEKAAEYLPERTEVFEGDVTDMDSLDKLFADIPENTTTYVIHCAAMVSVSSLVKEKIWNVNVVGTEHYEAMQLEQRPPYLHQLYRRNPRAADGSADLRGRQLRP